MLRYWHLHFHRQIDGLKAMYVNGMLRSLVLALVGIFTPIYLYQIGREWYGMTMYGVVLVAGYFLLLRLTSLTFVIPISKIIERWGFRRSIGVSLIFLALNLGLLIMAPRGIIYLILAAICAGLNIPFYWVSRSSAVSQDGDRHRIGTQMGWMAVVEQIAGMLGPVSAGLIIAEWGFSTLFVSAIMILVVSVIPLWSMTPHVHRNGASLKGFWRYVTNRRYFHNAVGAGAKAIDDYAVTALWPLAIFILGISTPVLGGVFSLVALLSIVIRLLTGKIFDKLHKKRGWADEILFGIAASAVSLVWIGRLFARSIGTILGIDLAGAIFGTTYSNMYVDYEFLGGMRMGNIAYWVYQEMMYSMATIGIMVMAIVGAWLGIWQELIFLSAALWVLVSIVMARESNMRG